MKKLLIGFFGLFIVLNLSSAQNSGGRTSGLIQPYQINSFSNPNYIQQQQQRPATSSQRPQIQPIRPLPGQTENNLKFPTDHDAKPAAQIQPNERDREARELSPADSSSYYRSTGGNQDARFLFQGGQNQPNWGWNGGGGGGSTGGILACSVCNSHIDYSYSQRCCSTGFNQCCNVGYYNNPYQGGFGNSGFYPSNYYSGGNNNYLYNSNSLGFGLGGQGQYWNQHYGGNREKPGQCYRGGFGSSNTYFGSAFGGAAGTLNQNAGYYYTRRSVGADERSDKGDSDTVVINRATDENDKEKVKRETGFGNGGYGYGGRGSGGGGGYYTSSAGGGYNPGFGYNSGGGGGYHGGSGGGYQGGSGGGYHGGHYPSTSTTYRPGFGSGDIYCRRSDYECPGTQKCCSGICTNPATFIG